jgi:hypothetical protein
MSKWFAAFVMLAIVAVASSIPRRSLDAFTGARSLNESLPVGSYLKELRDEEVQAVIDDTLLDMRSETRGPSLPPPMAPATALRWIVDNVVNRQFAEPFELAWYYFERDDPSDARAYAILKREAKVEAKILYVWFSSTAGLRLKAVKVVGNLRDEEVAEITSLARNRA